MSILQILALLLLVLTIVLIIMRLFGSSPTSDQLIISSITFIYTTLFDIYRRLGNLESWMKEKLENIEKLLQRKKA